MIAVAMTHLLYNTFFFASVPMLPLGHVMAGMSFSAMLLVAILNRVWKGKDLGCGHTCSLLMAGVGIAMVTQPWSVFGHGFIPPFMKSFNNVTGVECMDDEQDNLSNITNVTQVSNVTTQTARDHTNLIGIVVTTGYVLITLAGFIQAINYLVALSYLGEKSPIFLGLIMSFINCPASILISIYMEELVLFVSLRDIFLIILHCICTSLGMLFSFAAAQRIGPSQVCLVESFVVIIFLIFQYTPMAGGLTGRRNALEVVGCVVVTVCIGLSTLTHGPTKLHEDL